MVLTKELCELIERGLPNSLSGKELVSLLIFSEQKRPASEDAKRIIETLMEKISDGGHEDCILGACMIFGKVITYLSRLASKDKSFFKVFYKEAMNCLTFNKLNYADLLGFSREVIFQTGMISDNGNSHLIRGGKVYKVKMMCEEDEKKTRFLSTVKKQLQKEYGILLVQEKKNYETKLKEVKTEYEEIIRRLKKEYKGKIVFPSWFKKNVAMDGVRIFYDAGEGWLSFLVPVIYRINYVTIHEKRYLLIPEHRFETFAYLEIGVSSDFRFRDAKLRDEFLSINVPRFHAVGEKLCLGTYKDKPKIDSPAALYSLAADILSILEQISPASRNPRGVSHSEVASEIEGMIREDRISEITYSEDDTDAIPPEPPAIIKNNSTIPIRGVPKKQILSTASSSTNVVKIWRT